MLRAKKLMTAKGFRILCANPSSSFPSAASCSDPRNCPLSLSCVDRCCVNDRASVSIRAKDKPSRRGRQTFRFSLERRKGQHAVECNRTTVTWRICISTPEDNICEDRRAGCSVDRHSMTGACGGPAPPSPAPSGIYVEESHGAHTTRWVQ